MKREYPQIPPFVFFCCKIFNSLIPLINQIHHHLHHHHHIEESLPVGCSGTILMLQGTPHDLHQLAKLTQLAVHPDTFPFFYIIDISFRGEKNLQKNIWSFEI